MAGADLAGIDAVVVEVLAVQRPRLETDLAVFGDDGRIELDLELHVGRDREQRRGGFLHQRLLGFRQRVDIGGDAVAVLRDGLHELIVVVALPEAEDRQEDAAFALRLDHRLQRLVIARPDVEVAVGRQHDAVDAVLDETLFGQAIGLFQPRRAGGRTARLKPLHGVEDLRLLRRFRRLQHRAGLARIGDDGDRVVGLQSVDQQPECRLEQRQLVGLVHRAGDVDQEHQVGARPLGRRDVIALDADVKQLGVGVPRRRRHRHRRLERRFRAVRPRIGIGEVVDQFLHPHARGIGKDALLQRAAHHGIGRRVDIRRERGNRRLGDGFHRVGVELLDPVAPAFDHRHGFRQDGNGRLGARRDQRPAPRDIRCELGLGRRRRGGQRLHGLLRHHPADLVGEFPLLLHHPGFRRGHLRGAVAAGRPRRLGRAGLAKLHRLRQLPGDIARHRQDHQGCERRARHQTLFHQSAPYRGCDMAKTSAVARSLGRRRIIFSRLVEGAHGRRQCLALRGLARRGRFVGQSFQMLVHGQSSPASRRTRFSRFFASCTW